MTHRVKKVSIVPDEEDLAVHKINLNGALATQRLRELVPLLGFVGAEITEVSPERTVLTVPLLETAMNQNGTQQAAVFYLLADYTLGIGMFATIPGIYAVGVHDRCNAQPIQFWLKGGRVTHLGPGRGQIKAVIEISPEIAQGLRAQLVAKGRCSLKHEVKIYQEDKLVAIAEHEMGIYADRSAEDEKRPSPARVDRLKVSALMLAGLRNDSISRQLAGEQGLAIAARMTKMSPQLGTLVRARMMNIESEIIKGSFSQVVVLGAGLDPKPLKFASSDQQWFLLDLPDMLAERRAKLEGLGLEPSNTFDVPVDLRRNDWSDDLISRGFDPNLPTLIVFEGVSMYLYADDLRRVLNETIKICQNRDSRLWLDHSTIELLERQEPEVTHFLENMSRLGEPFVTGFTDIVSLTQTRAWLQTSTLSAGDVIGLNDSIHQGYLFSMLQPAHASS